MLDRTLPTPNKIKNHEVVHDLHRTICLSFFSIACHFSWTLLFSYFYSRVSCPLCFSCHFINDIFGFSSFLLFFSLPQIHPLIPQLMTSSAIILTRNCRILMHASLLNGLIWLWSGTNQRYQPLPEYIKLQGYGVASMLQWMIPSTWSHSYGELVFNQNIGQNLLDCR